jgi:hypothetical protein
MFPFILAILGIFFPFGYYSSSGVPICIFFTNIPISLGVVFAIMDHNEYLRRRKEYELNYDLIDDPHKEMKE